MFLTFSKIREQADMMLEREEANRAFQQAIGATFPPTVPLTVPLTVSLPLTVSPPLTHCLCASKGESKSLHYVPVSLCVCVSLCV